MDGKSKRREKGEFLDGGEGGERKDKDLNLVTGLFGGKTENEEGAGQPLPKSTSGILCTYCDGSVIPNTAMGQKCLILKCIPPARNRGRWGNKKIARRMFELFCFF